VPLRAVVFDFDGVIANSEPLHYQAFRDVLAAKALTLTETEYYGRYLGYDDVGVFERFGTNAGAGWTSAEVRDLVIEKARRMEVLERDTSVLFPGAELAVRRMAAAVPIAIASGALGAEIRRVLDGANLTSLFSAIVSAEDTPVSKPAPDPYRRAVERLTATDRSLREDQCVAIEDSIWGLESARSAGLRTIGITHTYDRAALSIADMVIDSLDEVQIGAISRLFHLT
jgi:beta-phosphoglucomutase